VRLFIAAAILACAVLAATPTARADDADLAKKLTNPISDLVSVPLQFNWEFGEGENQDMWEITNLQPVVPFKITGHTNMIARLIMPMINTPGGTTAGDMTFSLFFSPASSSGPTWGVGPVLVLPRTGAKWNIGPTFVLFDHQGPMTYGLLVNHYWSFAGDRRAADVTQTLLQPSFAYTTAKAVTLTLQSETTANWEAASGNVWSIPINALITKVARFGPFRGSFGGGVGYFLDSPDGGPEWKLRGIATILLPAAD
jgi:hypothetical protein